MTAPNKWSRSFALPQLHQLIITDEIRQLDCCQSYLSPQHARLALLHFKHDDMVNRLRESPTRTRPSPTPTCCCPSGHHHLLPSTGFVDKNTFSRLNKRLATLQPPQPRSESHEGMPRSSTPQVQSLVA